ncbi:MAG: hypothetical protein NTW87_07310 [Planctomycetota bacterium]|nr:hypothetical protein [Planctomycetota bacterium]
MPSAHAQNFRLGSATTSLTSTAPGAQSTYQLACKLKNKVKAEITTSNTVTYTFPAGTNCTTITAISFYGSAVSLSDPNTVITATSVKFMSPVHVPQNATFTGILAGITNPLTPGAYRASISTQNSSSGTNSGANIFA